MKNFKLLLATTAILSTALAINVKADDEPSTAELNVNVEFLAPDVVIPVQHIDFAKILVDPQQVGQQFSATMDPATGKITDYERIFGEPKNGQVSLEYLYSAKKTIQLEDHVTLYDLEGHYINFTPDFTEIYSYTSGPFYAKTYGIGGTLSNISSGLYLGAYSGKLTVTVIADE